MHILNFIGGEFVESSSGRMDAVNPATAEAFGSLPDSNTEDVDAAVRTARTVFDRWRSLGASKRADYLLRVADLLEQKLDEFAEAESLDQGKPVWLAKMMDIPRAVLNLRHFAHTGPHHLGVSKFHPDLGFFNYTIAEPIGVAGLISPWNLPLYLLTFKVAPALVAGNTVVAKPSELTSLTAFKFCQLFKEAGVPPGVFNVVFGRGNTVGEALVLHKDVPIISFTGSTFTGARIATLSAPLFKKLSLEMGGKNAAIVFEDCDLDLAVTTLTRAAFINQGQVCLCTSRIFVQDTIYEQFIEKFVASARDQTVGDPRDPETKLGPLNSEAHYHKVKGHVLRAVREGAKIMCGEGVDKLNLSDQNKKGYFMAATVITDVPDTATCMTEEIFGPVTCVTRFSEEDEVVKRANSVRYGLCASVFSKDLSRANRVASLLQAGTVWVNCWLVRDLDMPFGGTKDSGIGREGTMDSWHFFTEQKTVCMKIDNK